MKGSNDEKCSIWKMSAKLNISTQLMRAVIRHHLFTYICTKKIKLGQNDLLEALYGKIYTPYLGVEGKKCINF